MTSFNELVPLHSIDHSQEELLSIKRNDLVPLLSDQSKLNYYADHIVQAQMALLNGIDAQLIQKMSETISNIIQQLNSSKKKFRQRKFNALQKWLGLDLEFNAEKIHHHQDLAQLIHQADQLAQRLKIETQKSQARVKQVEGLREQMAKYIFAAKDFLKDYPQFAVNRHPLDNFNERLSKKIHTLETLQASNDIVLMQMQLTQQLSLTLIDRFSEAQQILIPAWQYHLEQSQQRNTSSDLEQLDRSREKLIRTLKQSLKKE